MLTLYLKEHHIFRLPSIVLYLIPPQWLLNTFQKTITPSSLNSPFFTIYNCIIWYNYDIISNNEAFEWKCFEFEFQTTAYIENLTDFSGQADSMEFAESAESAENYNYLSS